MGSKKKIPRVSRHIMAAVRENLEKKRKTSKNKRKNPVWVADYNRQFDRFTPEEFVLILRHFKRMEPNSPPQKIKEMSDHTITLLSLWILKKEKRNTLNNLIFDCQTNSIRWQKLKLKYPESLVCLNGPPPRPSEVTDKQKKSLATINKKMKAIISGEGQDKINSNLPNDFLQPSNVKRTYISDPKGTSKSISTANSDDKPQDIDSKPNPDYQFINESSVNPFVNYDKKRTLADLVRDETQSQPVNSRSKTEAEKTAQVPVRDGQATFRAQILELYKAKCCVTGCSVEEVLEAAHIHDYSESRNNDLTNGICLRVDIHRLFDKGLIIVMPSYVVRVDDTLKNSNYWAHNGKKITLPTQEIDWPKKKHLLWRLSNLDEPKLQREQPNSNPTNDTNDRNDS